MSKEEQSESGNILPMVRTAVVTPMPALDKIERYWNVVRANRLVPSRCEIDPRGLEGVLGNAFILERITGGLARFRIAGSHISDLSGLELRQMPISALFMPTSREVLSDALTSTFEDPASIRMRIESKGGFGREALKGEMILMPLRSDLGQVDRVLGGIVMEGKIGRTPRRLEITSQSRQSLVGYAGPGHAKPELSAVTPPKASHAPIKPVQNERRRSAPVKKPAGRKDLDRTHLRLVIDNE